VVGRPRDGTEVCEQQRRRTRDDERGAHGAMLRSRRGTRP
jgi:hypothetical protein